MHSLQSKSSLKLVPLASFKVKFSFLSAFFSFKHMPNCRLIQYLEIMTGIPLSCVCSKEIGEAWETFEIV